MSMIKIDEKHQLLLEAAASKRGVTVEYLVQRGISLALIEGDLNAKGMKMCCAQEIAPDRFVVKSVIA